MSIYVHGHPTMNTGAPRTSPPQFDAQSTATTAVASPLPSPVLSSHPQNLPSPPQNLNIAVPGWSELTNLIAKRPDLEAFPSFTDLNIKSLLFYQAELIFLRERLHNAEWNECRNGNGNPFSTAEDLKCLFLKYHLAEKPPTDMPEQWTLLVKIRKVLEKYSKRDRNSGRDENTDEILDRCRTCTVLENICTPGR
jgi:hypothetical protein